MKQTLFDILVVSIVPLLILVGYFTVQAGGIQSTFMLVTGASPQDKQLGERAVQALTELGGIRLDNSIFDIKEFKEMKAPTQPVPKNDPVGSKTNPFVD